MSRLLIKRDRRTDKSVPFKPAGFEGVHFCYIWLNPRVSVIVDPDDYEKYKNKHCRLKKSGCCYYAAYKETRNGKTIWHKLHREIMHTPPGMDCHHKHGHTMDCRKSELENLTPDEHMSKHLSFL